jgi:hypothetical protein
MKWRVAVFVTGLCGVRQLGRRMTFGSSLAACLVLIALPFASFGQTNKAESCPIQGEQIYIPGADSVKPPRLQVERTPLDKPIKMKSRLVLQLTVSAMGKICEIQVLETTDEESAKQVASYVADNFRFRPATRRGKPVAARFKVVFGSEERTRPE